MPTTFPGISIEEARRALQRQNQTIRRFAEVASAHGKPEDVDAAVVEGASARVWPLLMTLATTVLGLLPLLWEAGIAADVSARTAAPVVGGLWSCMFLTLLVLPAAYAMWRRYQVRVAFRGRPRCLMVSRPLR